MTMVRTGEYMSFRKSVCFFVAAALIHCAALSETLRLSIDAAEETGPVTHGATGFLYGLGDPGIPAQQMLSALHPVTAAQKAPDGLQHPNGDALSTARQFFDAGGRDLQVYMQDIYKEWPYEKLGIDDYLPKIRTMVQKGKQSPYRDRLSWIPLNEPDVIWYNDSLLFRDFCEDWKKCYAAIKETDPQARVVGPNTTLYNERFMDRFLKFAKENKCLPDTITWHELQNDFFTDWENHYDNYRALEKKYGIGPLPITINEYARFSGDLAMPGKLVQFISRFEGKGVNGCLAYWTTAGSLNDLVTRNTYPTGAWWLYYWYAQMEGRRIKVIPPNPHAEGLQGLASFDPSRKQIRVVAGGTAQPVDVDIAGAAQKLGTAQDGSVQVIVKKTGSSGLNPSVIPATIYAGTVRLSDGALTVPIPAGNVNDAYQIIVSADEPSGAESGGKWTYRAREERVQGGTAEIAVEVNEPGYYTVAAQGAGSTGLSVNDVPAGNIPDGGSVTLYLCEGINLLSAKAASQALAEKLTVRVRKADSGTAKAARYEAESGENEMSNRVAPNKKGQAVEQRNPSNDTQYLSFKKVRADKAALHAVTVRYQNGELGDGASNYNSNIVDRSADVSVNGKQIQTAFFRNTLGWKDFYTTTLILPLSAGENTITFTAPRRKMLPTFDYIDVAPFIYAGGPVAEENTPPQAQASAPGEVKFPAPVSLSVIAADDMIDGKPLTYEWKSKADGVQISGADSAFATAAVPKAGTYGFTCTVSDGEKSASVSVTARVYPEGLYEAEAEGNVLTGTANIAASANASGGKVAGYIGNGAENTLTFTNVTAAQAGTYTVTISYISGENRSLSLSANGGKPVSVSCPSTGSWTTVGTVKAKIKLQKGLNTLTISNAGYYAPDIDCILVEK